VTKVEQQKYDEQNICNLIFQHTSTIKGTINVKGRAWKMAAK
jgi:hypothetical protein